MKTKTFDKELPPEKWQYLVLGAPGMLGRQVVRDLVGRGWPVRAMRRWDEGSEGIEFDGVDIVVGDVFDATSLSDAIAGVNGVFYCVAPDVDEKPREILRKSVEGIRRVLKVCREMDVERMVVTSSASTVGRGAPGTRLDEESFYLPGTSDDAYVEAKYAVELECYRYVADGFDVVMVNPGLLVGPGVDLSAYARLGVAGTQPVAVVDVREAARVHVEAMHRGRPGQRYLVASENSSAQEVFDGWPSKGKNSNPPREAYLVESGQWLDCSLAEQELGLKRG